MACLATCFWGLLNAAETIVNLTEEHCLSTEWVAFATRVPHCVKMYFPGRLAQSGALEVLQHNVTRSWDDPWYEQMHLDKPQVLLLLPQTIPQPLSLCSKNFGDT